MGLLCGAGLRAEALERVNWSQRAHSAVPCRSSVWSELDRSGPLRSEPRPTGIAPSVLDFKNKHINIKVLSLSLLLLVYCFPKEEMGTVSEPLEGNLW